jgi:hypothetical protein
MLGSGQLSGGPLVKMQAGPAPEYALARVWKTGATSRSLDARRLRVSFLSALSATLCAIPAIACVIQTVVEVNSRAIRRIYLKMYVLALKILTGLQHYSCVFTGA